MTQPEFVPLSEADKVRAAERLPAPDAWTADRVAEISSAGQPHGNRFGSPGPDQGFGLKLARRFKDKLRLMENEQAEDAVAGCVAVGLKRAALFGRAPVIYDMEFAYLLWGFLGDAPQSLLDFRAPLFQAAAHHYWDQRAIVDRVSDDTLRLTPNQIRDRVTNWESLIRYEDEEESRVSVSAIKDLGLG